MIVVNHEAVSRPLPPDLSTMSSDAPDGGNDEVVTVPAPVYPKNRKADEPFKLCGNTYPRSGDIKDLDCLEAWIDRAEQDLANLQESHGFIIRMFSTAGVAVAISGVVLIAQAPFTREGSLVAGGIAVALGVVLIVVIGVGTRRDSDVELQLSEQLLRYKQQRRRLQGGLGEGQ